MEVQTSNIFYTGTKSAIGSSGVQVTTLNVKCNRGLQLSAPTSNSGIVYIGNRSSFTYGTVDATDGFPLHSGESILLPIRDPSKVYVASPVGGQLVNWILF